MSDPAAPLYRPTILAGPSGVGKGTVVAALRRRRPEVWLSISVTTRTPRPGERDGVHYHFVTDAQFDDLVATDGLLEWAEYGHHRYGTPAAAVRAQAAAGVPVLLELDLAGVRQARDRLAGAQTVLLAPPSREELRRRLAHRGTETPAAMATRLAIAEAELAAADEFDRVIVNDRVERAVEELVDFMGLCA
ncbi:MAG: guanylate kinase [Propionibacteriaceae bacterium]|jgi:guanylate kinase|nr:guanylate kinase [Propionibacteriaceae bacterium]